MKRPLRNYIRKIQLNNMGVTLIELIVAILILAVLGVSVMQIFSSAAKTNMINTRNADADTVGQNVLEAIKVNGLELTAKEIFRGSKIVSPNTVDWFGIPVQSVEDDTTRDDGGTGSVHFKNGVSDYFENGLKKYDFKINGINEGSTDFNVTVSFESVYSDNAGAAAKDVNEVDPYSLALFRGNESLIIDPINRTAEDYLDADEINKCVSASDRYIKEVNDANQEAVAEHNYYHPDDKWTASPRDKISLATIVENLTRTLEITVDKRTKSGKDYYYVKADFVYSLPVNVNGTQIIREAYRSERNICDTQVDDKLKNIYVLYTPYPYMSKTAFDSELRVSTEEVKPYKYLTDKLLENIEDFTTFCPDNENVIVKNDTDLELDIYLAIQYKEHKDLAAGKPATKLREITVSSIGGTGKKASLYSQSTLSDYGNNDVIENKNTIVKKLASEHKNRLIKITINVESTDGSIKRKPIISTIEQ